MKKRHLIVISVDALVYEDIEDTSELPVFGELIGGGSLIKRVRTIYPSLTHPVHASIITGRPAGVTGIVSNTVFTPGVSVMPWYNRLSEIGCETIFDIVHRAGLKSAACRWPVTANAGEKIDYLIPELMDEVLEAAGGDVLQAHFNAGMSECLGDIFKKAVEHFGDSVLHPVCDEVQSECACEIIRRYKPDIMFTHPCFVDAERHRTGLFSPYVSAAVKKSEEWISGIMRAAKDAGIYDDTDFVILSDHGHLDYSKTVRLNRFLEDEGFIKTGKDGGITDWEIYAQSCDLSALIYLKRPDDERLKKNAKSLLEKWTRGNDAFGDSFLSAEEADRLYGLKGDFSFVLEAGEGFCFSDELSGEGIFEEKKEAGCCGHSAHGHRPEKGPQPVFIGFGPDFEKGKVKEEGSILDCFALFRRILGV